jgi:NADH-quinone oxidoreductase subunit J
MLINSLYYFFIILVAVGAITILLTSHILYAILILILVVICLAALYFLQGAPFVAIIQLIIHAGGILVLLICSLVFFKPTTEISNRSYKIVYKGIVVGFTTICLTVYIWSKLRLLTHQFNLPSSDILAGTVQNLGYQIFGPYGLILELISILLLIALVGVVHIVHQKYRINNK